MDIDKILSFFSKKFYIKRKNNFFILKITIIFNYIL